MNMNLLTTTAKENDLEGLVDSFTEAMQTACREAFKIITNITMERRRNQSPGGQTVLIL